MAFSLEALRILTVYIEFLEFEASGHEVVVYAEEMNRLLNMSHLTNQPVG